MESARNSERRFGLGWALGASVGFHLLLLLIAWLFPTLGLFRTESLEVVPEETVLRFDFAPVTDTDRSTQPLGDVPIPVPESPAVQSTPSPPVPEPVEATRPTETFERPAETAPPEQSFEEVERPDQGADTGVTLPEDGTAVVQPPAFPERQPDPVEPKERELDLDSALSSFRNSMNQRAQQQQQQSQGVYRPDVQQLPSAGFGFGNLEFESRDYDWTDYARQIYIAIWRAWHNRLYQTTDSFERWAHSTGEWMMRQRANRITFTIQSNGQVTGIVLEGPSGCVPLDDSALDALREVVLPPLPSDFPRSTETIHATFLADGDIRGMRRTLSWMKANNYF
ncbi:MAG: energy transducer TonB [Acidobacteriota bacterium]|nr:energy transducer TonB [Acidobacteriota bacterium]